MTTNTASNQTSHVLPTQTPPKPYSTSQRSSIIKYYRSIEFFLPFSLDEVFDRYTNYIEYKLNQEILLQTFPWQDPAGFDLDLAYEYSYDIFLAPFELAELSKTLRQILPEIENEILPDPRSFEGLSCCLRLTIDNQGRTLNGDTSFSTAPWAVARWGENKPLSLAEL